MTQSGKTLLLMLWKNWILQIRRPVGTAVELITPILLVAILVALRVGQFEEVDVCFSTYDDDPLTISQPSVPYTIFYAPITNSSEAVAEILRRELPFASVVGVESESELESRLVGVSPPLTLSTTISGVQVDTNTGCLLRGAGIVFEDLESRYLEITLRLRQEVGQLDTWETATREPRLVPVQEPTLAANPYLQEGFLHLQKVVEEALIEWRSGRELGDVAVSVRQVPVPAFTSSGFVGDIVGQIAFFVILGFLYPAAVFCKELVLEKELRVRELLLIAGLKQWVLWTAWYIKQFLFFSFISLTITPILKYGGIFPQTDFFVLLLFLVLFSASIVSFSFLISVLFDTGQAALLGGFVLFFLNYMPYSYVFSPDIYETLTLSDKLGISLLSNSAMSFGLQVMFTAELAGPGIQWDTISTLPTSAENIHLGHVCIMLSIDIIIYMIIAWYIDGIKPGKYGIAKPLYFPCLPSYWLGRPRNAGKNKQLDDEMEMENLRGSEHEPEPKEFEVGVRIKNLTKIYDKTIPERLGLKSRGHQHTREVAVDGLSLNLYIGQITALLGHNGAGKTTTMSILTGLYTPTDGTALIGGYDIHKDMETIRKSMSICPQHDVLYGRLTAAEHLRMSGVFKGLNWKEASRQISQMVEDIDLVEKRDTPASQLSGGQKRKLSVCMALMGGPKLVVLDEPTSGMDPYARRATWNLLIKYKKDRTIVFSTHFMDEADILGDRIAIMAAGKLRCSGSSLFLKSRYGVGYHMVMEKAPSCTSEQVMEVVSLMKSHVQGAKCVLDAGAELAFILPAEDTKAFPSLFQDLERKKEELGIAGFGVSVTTMEEVFLKVKDESDEDIKSRLHRRGTLRPGSKRQPVEPVEHTPPPAPEGNNVGVRLWWQQYYGLIVKKTLDTVRYWQVFLAICLLPIVAALLALLLFVFLGFTVSDPARELSVENSAIDTSNRIFFWAEFGDFTNDFNFESLTADDVQATDLLNITAGVVGIMDSVQSISNVSDCCNYQYQILDKYCALRSADELNSCTGSNFGYSRCKNCLECCASRFGGDASCTNPFSQQSSSEQVCPAIPKVSVADATRGTATGRLDSDNTFVAEYLLRFAEEFGNYQTQVMGGLTIGREEPVYSACGCSSPSGFTQSYVAPLQQCSDSGSGDRSYVVSGAFEWYNSTECTSLLQTFGVGSGLPTTGAGSGLPTTGAGSGLPVTSSTGVVVSQVAALLATLNASVRVDGSSLGALQALSCSTIDASSLASDDNNSLLSGVQDGCGENSTTERPVSAFFPQQTQRTSVTVWYSGKPWHMSAAMLNVFYNVWLRELTGEEDISITVNNHPLPNSNEGQLFTLLASGNGYYIGVVIVGGFSLLLSLLILPLLNEKSSQVKHLQHLSGVRSSAYWASILTVDGLYCVVIIPIVIAIFAAFQLEEFAGENLGAVAVLLVLCCMSGIPLVYLFSFVFTDGLTAFAVLVFLLFLLTSQVARISLASISSIAVKDVFHYVCLTVPTFGLLSGISDVYTNYITRKLCNEDTATQLVCEANEGIRYVENIFSLERPGIGFNIVYAVVETVLFFAILWALEHPLFLTKLVERLRGLRNKGPEDFTPITTQDEAPSIFCALPLIHKIEDTDVTREREKVKNGDITDEHVVVIRNLIKVYPHHLDGLTLRPRKVAVKGLTLAIPKGECFGLLGTNGAGKTTTFRMLTGDLNPTSGSATIKGLDVVTQFNQVRQHIGYCPQFGALLERLTGRELLTVFARLRGLPESSVKATVESEIRRLDLIEHADKLCGKYSGGNKRKLSTGIALVGNPAVVFLDEPTTGMDTATRHFLWKVLTGITKNGQSIILTSHSMEECEALCSRVAILVNGQFRCLGSIQHVKNKYGAGVVLQAKIELQPKVKEPPSHPRSPGILARITGRARRGRTASRQDSQLDDNEEGTPPSSPGILARITGRTRRGRTASRQDSQLDDNEEGTPPSSPGILARITGRARRARTAPRQESQLDDNEEGAPPSSPGILARITGRARRARTAPRQESQLDDNEGGSTNRHRGVGRRNSAPATVDPPSTPVRRQLGAITNYFARQLTLVEGGETHEEPMDPFDTTSIQSFLSQRYRGTTLLEEHQGFVSYQLPLRSLSWATVFKDIEDNKERLGITDYSISQITLEQVFINFSKKQKRVFKK